MEALRLAARVQLPEKPGRRGVEAAAVPGDRGGAGHGPEEALRPAAPVPEEDGGQQEPVAGERRRQHGGGHRARCLFLHLKKN